MFISNSLNSTNIQSYVFSEVYDVVCSRQTHFVEWSKPVRKIVFWLLGENKDYLY